MEESGTAPQVNIARHKYAVLHSPWYGQEKTPWEGLQTGTSTVEDYKAYLRRVVECTRVSPYGGRRIAFGPVAHRKMETADVIKGLAEVLHDDATKGDRS